MKKYNLLSITTAAFLMLSCGNNAKHDSVVSADSTNTQMDSIHSKDHPANGRPVSATED